MESGNESDIAILNAPRKAPRRNLSIKNKGGQFLDSSSDPEGPPPPKRPKLCHAETQTPDFKEYHFKF